MASLLVERLQAEGIRNPDVLEAIARVPRDKFVREDLRKWAHEDEALPIECGQTISQPYVVARMTELLLSAEAVHKVLEVGTGSGYQAAVLAQLVDEVYTVERIKTLLEKAEHRFEILGYDNIHTKHGDGYLGWPEHAPYDGIIVTAAPTEVPPALRKQLADNGRMVIPIGIPFGTQEIILLIRHGDDFEIERYDFVVFVPMVHGMSEE